MLGVFFAPSLKNPPTVSDDTPLKPMTSLPSVSMDIILSVFHHWFLQKSTIECGLNSIKILSKREWIYLKPHKKSVS